MFHRTKAITAGLSSLKPGSKELLGGRIISLIAQRTMACANLSSAQQYSRGICCDAFHSAERDLGSFCAAPIVNVGVALRFQKVLGLLGTAPAPSEKDNGPVLVLGEGFRGCECPCLAVPHVGRSVADSHSLLRLTPEVDEYRG